MTFRQQFPFLPPHPVSIHRRGAQFRQQSVINYNAHDSALAIIREKAFQADRFQSNFHEPNERSTRYREGVREAVASLLDPFQPDNDEASRLANPAASARSPDDRS